MDATKAAVCHAQNLELLRQPAHAVGVLQLRREPVGEQLRVEVRVSASLTRRAGVAAIMSAVLQAHFFAFGADLARRVAQLLALSELHQPSADQARVAGRSYRRTDEQAGGFPDLLVAHCNEVMFKPRPGRRESSVALPSLRLGH